LRFKNKAISNLKKYPKAKRQSIKDTNSAPALDERGINGR
jgi:hypothetical protein